MTDLALFNFQSNAGYIEVKKYIDSGYLSVIETILLQKIDLYHQCDLNIEECSIRKVIDIFTEKDVAVTILVDEDWTEMKMDNIEIISNSNFLMESSGTF